MKVKPYRRCDICEDDYFKVKNCMKIKYYRPGNYYEPANFKNLDVCPICANKMIEWIRTQRWWEGDEE